MKIKFKLFLIMASAVSVFLVAIYFWTDMRWSFVQNPISIENLSLKNLEKDKGSLEALHYTNEVKSHYRFFHINFSFKAISTEKDFVVLETAKFDSAIRLKLTKPSTLSLSIGPAQNFLIYNDAVFGKSHEVSLDVSPLNQLRVVVDNNLLLNQKQKLNYKINDIIIGADFNGDLKVNSLRYGFMEKNKVFINGFLFWVILTTLLLTIVIVRKLFFYFKNNSNLKQKISKCLTFTLLRPYENSEKIILATTIICIGTMAWILFQYISNPFIPRVWANGLPMTFHYPVNMFCDFFRNFDLQARMGLESPSNYFPFCSVLFGLFGLFGKGSPYLAVAYSVGISSIIIVWLTWKYFKDFSRPGRLLCAFIVSIMAYPVLFTMHTGNLENWVFIFLCLFFVSYKAGHSLLSTFFLAASIAMKLYPAIFILVFVLDKRFYLILHTLLWVVVLTLLPFLIWPISPSLYLHSLVVGMRFYNEVMVVSGNGVRFGHSLINFVRALWPNIQASSIYPMYYIFAGIVLMALSVYSIFIEKVFWKKMAILVIALCLLPPTSTEYKLLYFFIPFFYFVSDNIKSKSDLVYVVMFSLLFVNKGYCFFNDQFITLNSVGNTVVMISMLLTILVEHFLEWKMARSKLTAF